MPDYTFLIVSLSTDPILAPLRTRFLWNQFWIHIRFGSSISTSLSPLLPPLWNYSQHRSRMLGLLVASLECPPVQVACFGHRVEIAGYFQRRKCCARIAALGVGEASGARSVRQCHILYVVKLVGYAFAVYYHDMGVGHVLRRQIWLFRSFGLPL